MLFCALELALWRLDLVEEYEAGGRVVAAPAEPGGPPDAPGEEPKLLHRFRITVGNADAARPYVEAVLEAETKRWTFVASEVQGDGTGTLVYDLRLRKRMGPDALAAELRGRAAAKRPSRREQRPRFGLADLHIAPRDSAGTMRSPRGIL